MWSCNNLLCLFVAFSRRPARRIWLVCLRTPICAPSMPSASPLCPRTFSWLGASEASAPKCPWPPSWIGKVAAAVAAAAMEREVAVTHSCRLAGEKGRKRKQQQQQQQRPPLSSKFVCLRSLLCLTLSKDQTSFICFNKIKVFFLYILRILCFHWLKLKKEVNHLNRRVNGVREFGGNGKFSIVMKCQYYKYLRRKVF